METQKFDKQIYFGKQVEELDNSINKLERDLEALKALKEAFQHELTIIESRALDVEKL